jgi:hypothetical protein
MFILNSSEGAAIFNKTTFNIAILSMKIRKCDTQHDDVQYNDKKMTLSIMMFSITIIKCDTQLIDVHLRHSA